MTAGPDTAPEEFQPTLFINIVNPEVTIARVRKHSDAKLAAKGAVVTDGTSIKFENTQFLATTKEDYDIVKKTQPWAFEEPHDESLKFFEDTKTGFKTRNADAYSAWMDSDWREQIVEGMKA